MIITIGHVCVFEWAENSGIEWIRSLMHLNGIVTLAFKSGQQRQLTCDVRLNRELLQISSNIQHLASFFRFGFEFNQIVDAI